MSGVRTAHMHQQAAEEDVAALIEEPERLGFDLELVKTRPHAPRDPLPHAAPKLGTPARSLVRPDPMPGPGARSTHTRSSPTT